MFHLKVVPLHQLLLFLGQLLLMIFLVLRAMITKMVVLVQLLMLAMLPILRLPLIKKVIILSISDPKITPAISLLGKLESTVLPVLLIS